MTREHVNTYSWKMVKVSMRCISASRWFPPPKKHWNWEKEIWYDSVWGGVCQTHDASQIIGSVLGRVPKALIHLNLPLLTGAECTRDVGFLQSFLAEIWKSDLLQELFVFLCVKTGNEETKQDGCDAIEVPSYQTNLGERQKVEPSRVFKDPWWFFEGWLTDRIPVEQCQLMVSHRLRLLVYPSKPLWKGSLHGKIPRTVSGGCQDDVHLILNVSRVKTRRFVDRKRDNPGGIWHWEGTCTS